MSICACSSENVISNLVFGFMFLFISFHSFCNSFKKFPISVLYSLSPGLNIFSDDCFGSAVKFSAIASIIIKNFILLPFLLLFQELQV